MRNESARLNGLMEQSLVMTQNLEMPGVVPDVKFLEREVWQLERECRLLSTPLKTISRPSSATPSPQTSELRKELLSTKEELAELKRQVELIKNPPGSPTFGGRSRQNTSQHHYHHYYYHAPDFTRPLSYASEGKMEEDTPIRSRFFRELPTPPLSASSASASIRHQRFSSLFSAYPPADLKTPVEEVPPPLERTYSQDTIASSVQTDPYTKPLLTTPLKRSSSHESIFDQTLSTPVLTVRQSPRSSPLCCTTTSSPTYLSASAYLRQNTTSSLLLLSSTRGKQSRGLSSRKSFWNLFDKGSSPRTRVALAHERANTSDLGSPVVVCTEVDVGMLRDALEG